MRHGRRPIEGEEGISTLGSRFPPSRISHRQSTLWTIDDDSTLYLMKVFYAGTGSQKSAPEALRLAQKEHAQKVRPAQGRSLLLGRGFTLEGLAHIPRNLAPPDRFGLTESIKE